MDTNYPFEKFNLYGRNSCRSGKKKCILKAILKVNKFKHINNDCSKIPRLIIEILILLEPQQQLSWVN